MYRWCRGALTALVVTTVQQAPALAASQAKGDLDARLQDLKEQYESRLRHSPAALARHRANLAAKGAAGDFIVNNDGFIGQSNQSQIVVRRQPGGGTVAVWTDDRDGNPSIYGQVFDSLGAPIGENFRLHPDPNNLVQHDPDVAVRADGGFYAAMTQDSLDVDQNVLVFRFSKLGQRLGAGVSVAPDSTPATRLIQRRPGLCILSDSTHPGGLRARLQDPAQFQYFSAAHDHQRHGAPGRAPRRVSRPGGGCHHGDLRRTRARTGARARATRSGSPGPTTATAACATCFARGCGA